MRRHELSDEEWAVIEPLLPNKSRGIERVDDRQVINGILWRFRKGSSGEMCQNAMVRAQCFTIGSRVGTRLAFGTACV